MNFKRLLSISVLSAIMLAGMASPAMAMAGTIAKADKIGVGSMAPVVPIKMADGTHTTLAKLREPITIVALSGHSPDSSTSAHVKLAALASEYRYRPLTVAAFTWPTGDEQPQLGSDLLRFDDNERIAWLAFKKPERNMLYLIDERGMVQAVESMENLQRIVDKVRWMVLQAEENEESRYYQG